MGTRNACHCRRKWAPPNRHIAPTAVKFHGCGMIRVAAAAAIIVTRAIARGLNIPELLAADDCILHRRDGDDWAWRDVHWQQVNVITIVAANRNARFKLDRPIEDRPIIDKGLILAVFTARVNAGRQIGNQLQDELASDERSVEL